MASYCSDVETACSQRPKRTANSPATEIQTQAASGEGGKKGKEKEKKKRERNTDHIKHHLQWRARSAVRKTLRNAATQTLIVRVNPFFLNDHGNPDTTASPWKEKKPPKTQEHAVSSIIPKSDRDIKTLAANINAQAGGIIHPFMMCGEHKQELVK